MAGRGGGADCRHDDGAGARTSYRSIFVQHPDGACELDRRGRIVATNPALRRLTGYGDDELRHLDLLAALHTEDRAEMSRCLARTMAGEASVRPATLLRRDGRRIPVNVTTIPMVSDDSVTGVVAVLRDVSEEHETRRALAVSEARYRGTFEGSGSGIAVTDLDGRFLEVNPAYVGMLGYTAEELRATDLLSITHPDDLERNVAEIDRLLAGDASSFILEKRHLAKGGRVVWVRARISLLRALDGEPLQLVATTEDITGRKEAEIREERGRSLRRIAGRKAGVGGWAIDASSRELFWSDEIFGILDSEPGPTPTLEEGLAFYPNGHRRTITDAVVACLQDGAPFDVEVEVNTFTGRLISVRVAGEARRDPSGAVAEVIGSFQDITELRTAHALAAEVAHQLTDTLESMTDALYFVDPQWRFTYLNARACELLERDRAELIGRNLWEEFPSASGTDIHDAYHRAMDEQVTVVVPEYHYPPLDRWFEVNAYPSGDGLAVYFHDITEQHRARLADRDRETKLAQQAELLDKARDAIVVFDLDHTITYWNDGAERLYGWTADAALGEIIRELIGSDPRDFDAAVTATATRGEWVGELVQRTRDGRRISVEARWTLVRDDTTEEPRSILAINTDVTERKRLEAQFLRAQRLESLGTLAGGIAHDLNNVLAPVLMAVELLRMDDVDERHLELLRTIEASAERGADMIRQVLSFARGVEGRHQEISPRQILQDVGRILRDTLPRSIDLRIDADEGLWTIAGEATQIHQVLINLAVNARDAMPDGGVLRFTADNLDLDDPYAAQTHGADPGSYVRIQVEDQGVGMPPEVVDRIFEPFFTTKPHGEGTGLGLSTSLAIVSSHGGFLRAYSELGVGTTFRLYLPAASLGDGSRGPEPATNDLLRGEGELVLLVDDEAAVRDITRQTLETFGYRVLEARDGSECIALFVQHRADIAVVLTDMMMPVMDGPTTIRALLELDPTVTIIAASGLNATGRVAEAADAGIEHFLPKPYTAQSLLSTLRGALRAEA